MSVRQPYQGTDALFQNESRFYCEMQGVRGARGTDTAGFQWQTQGHHDVNGGFPALFLPDAQDPVHGK